MRSKGIHLPQLQAQLYNKKGRENSKFLRGLQGKQCLEESKKVKRGFSEALRIWGIVLTIDLKFQGASEII